MSIAIEDYTIDLASRRESGTLEWFLRIEMIGAKVGA